MRTLITTSLVAAACGLCFLAGHVAAQEEPAEGAGGFQLPEWAQKGPEHETMKKGAGEWDVTQKMWMDPSQPPMELQAHAVTELLWDGRYQATTFHGSFGGADFEGRLLLGFDRVDEEWVAVWIDSMSTYMSVSRGKEKDGAIVFAMHDPDFMTGEKKDSTMTQRWIDDDRYTLTFAEPGEDGKPHTTMEFTYDRKKADARDE